MYCPRFLPHLTAVLAAGAWPLTTWADSPDCVVVFNEVQYNPAGPSEDGEWIELFNQMGIMVDLSGWRLAGGIDFTFPNRTFLNPGAYLVIAKSPTVGQLGPFSGSLDNGGEKITLRNHSGRLMDVLDYGDGGRWPVIADGSGATLSKRDPYSANKPPEHWTSSAQTGGTPGAENFPDSSGPPPGETIVNLLAKTAQWRFHQSGFAAPADWAASAHSAGVGAWESGPGIMAYEPTLAEAIGTTLRWPGDNTPYVVTYYFETEFSLTAGEVASLRSLQLRHLLDDGAVLYLNGSEVYRANMPDGLIDSSTLADSGVEAAWSANITLPADSVVAGSNRISVEVHQESLTSGDLVFGLELDARLAESPFGDVGTVRLSEIPAADTAQFWIELVNTGPAPVELEGITVAVEADAQRTHILPNQTLEAGALLVLTESDLGFRPADGENIYLYSPSGTRVLDGQRVTGRLRGRAASRNGAWLYPNAATPGDLNTFTFRDEIVISEIHYNPAPLSAINNSENQWIEIANRSTVPVDLGGWEFDDGISFTFPSNTVLAPGEHACLAALAAEFTAAYPGARLLGEFAGSLSRSGERISLRAADRNPVDEVRYYDEGQRWPQFADGGGSSLELRDLDADNNVPEAWASSNETHQSSWQTYSYRARGTSNGGPDGAWRDFALGLLDAGEMLLDDISVVESPDGAATQFLSNTGFESGTNGWRLLGNHGKSQVIADPDNPGNRVLHLVAEGATEHMHNHLETTLAGGRSVSSGNIYEISFRAKWLTGSNQLHTRLYFNRAARNTPIDRPLHVGTPSASNSQAESNIGPTFTHFLHAPAVPDANEAVTVTARASDPDEVASLTLFYAVNEGSFRSVSMAPSGDGNYQAAIPGQAASSIVQFYIRAIDRMGVTSMLPARGPDSRALYKVQDGLSAGTGIHNFRIVMLPSDADFMHTPIHVMSNGRMGATVIDREKEIYYDVGVRLKGGQRARSTDIYLGFNVRFHGERLYRGVHRTVGVDRSGTPNEAPTELMFDLAISNSGGSPSRYTDLLYVMAPRSRHTGPSILQMARYNDVFLDSQYANGEDGYLYEYELIYYANSADGNGFKLPQPDTVLGQDVGDRGPDKERYRWFFLMKNNRAADNFDPIVRYNQHFGKSGAAFEEGLDEVIDVDGWLRGFAYSAVVGSSDNIASGFEHNGMYYAQPDGRVISLPHDMDFSWNAGLSIFANPECAKLTQDGRRMRLYLGHLHDIISTTFNQDYMNQWSSHLNTLDPAGYWSSTTSYINSRANNVLAQINNTVPPVAFSITTTSPLPVNGSAATISGDGWINVRNIRLAGSPEALPVNWTSQDSWELTIPAPPGRSTLGVEALDFTGQVIGNDSIEIDNRSLIEPASASNLALSELMYHPSDPTAAEQAAGFVDESAFEYFEVMNIGAAPVELSGASFASGLTFTFPQRTLAPGERAVVARDRAAFLFRHARASAALVDSEYKIGDGNKLDNGGELLVLLAANGDPIRSFSYADQFPWPASADGGGPSLVLIAPETNPDHADAANWRPSVSSGGVPGASDATSFTGDPEADPDGNGLSAFHEYALGTSLAITHPSFDFTAGTATFTFTRNLGADDLIYGFEFSTNLISWNPMPASRLSAIYGGDRTSIETWEVTLPIGADARLFVRLKVRRRNLDP